MLARGGKMEYSDQVKKIIKYIENKTELKEKKTVGTEYLLEAMVQEEDSISHFILSEYDFDFDDLVDYTDSLIVIRKDEEKYSNKLIEVLDMAMKNAEMFRENLVYEEHLFLAIIEIEDTIAKDILIHFEINLLNAMMEIRNMYIEDVKEKSGENKYLKSITEEAKKGLLPPFIGRNEYLIRIHNILSRKQKNNPLLIGSAGVGKTAIVEGLARYYLENNIDLEILSFDLGLALSGSKYRGDFEERITNSILEVEKREKSVIFIDEIHNLVGAGSAEGAMDAANMLKPILSRGNIRFIGATTIEEYYKYIYKDKALSRRFEPLFVYEPKKEETLKILKGIKNYYERYHNVLISQEGLYYIVEASSKILNRSYPDKAIDLLDETLAHAKIEKRKRVTHNDIDDVLMLIQGIKKPDYSCARNEKIKKAIRDYYLGIPKNYLLKMDVDAYEVEEKKNEIISSFLLTDEMILDINLKNYDDYQSISGLIGSSPGYIGYDEGGVLSEHVLKYPRCLLILRNYDECGFLVKSLFKEIFEKGFFKDKKGRTIYFYEVLMLFSNEAENKKVVGFLEKKAKRISSTKKTNWDSFLRIWRYRGYDFSFEIKEDEMDKSEVKDLLFTIINEKPKGKYKVYFKNSYQYKRLENHIDKIEKQTFS